jgi:uncharacterized protein DUF3631
MNLPPPKVCRRIRQLFGMLGSPNANEAGNAREKLTKLLAAHSLTWNDLPAILAATDSGTAQSGPAPSQQPTNAPQVNVLGLVLRLIELHVALTPEQRMAVALWILHTHVFGRFSITPRLALLSPVRGCGKTTLIILLELLAVDPYRSDNVSAAALYHLLAHREHTLLADEGDNLGLLKNNVLRAVFNTGHRRGGAISRFVGGWSRKFLLFAPLAVAAIGTLPLPLMHRAIVINMRRAPGDARLEQLDEFDPTFPAARAEIQKWAAICSLAREPEMPPELHNRAADNWRVLLAIADDLGHGEAARAAALALSANRLDEDPGIVLLVDIRTVFETLSVDRIPSASLVRGLLALDDSPWHDWRGPQDDRPARKLSQSELACLLKPFEIRPRTVWPAHRLPGAKSKSGYYRSQFEDAWAAYCPSDDTPTHFSRIKYLRRS